MKKATVYKTVLADPYESADAVNFEGSPAWKTPPSEYYKQLMYTGGVYNTFYENVQLLIKRASKIIAEYMRKDPKDAIEIAVAARNDGYMRSMPIMALAYLSEMAKSAKENGNTELFTQCKALFKENVEKILLTPRDIVEFIDITRSLRGMGRLIKETIAKIVTEKTKEFTAIKYSNQLRTIIKLVHPKPADDLQAAIFGYVLKKLESIPENLEIIKTFEAYKKGEIEFEEAAKRIDMQTLVGVRKIPDEKWKDLIQSMSTLQLVMNFVAIERKIGKVPIDPKKLSPEELRKGKVNPYRLGQAYMLSRNFDNKTLLGDAFNDYCTKANPFSESRKKIVVAPDISGSMTLAIGNKVPSKIAGLFTAVLGSSSATDHILMWDTEVHDVDPRILTPIDIYETIAKSVGGGTFMEAPIKEMIKKKIFADAVVLITDSMEWGKGWLHSWKEYLAKINPNAIAILIRIDPYPTSPFPPSATDKYHIYQIYGWNSTILDVITDILM